MIDGQQVELTKDMFEMAPANFGDNEAISRPSLTFWQDARKRLFKNPGCYWISNIMLYYFNGNICTYVF